MLDRAMQLAKANQIQAAETLYKKALAASPANAKILQAFILFYNRYAFRPRAAVPLVEKLLKAKPKLVAAHVLAAETWCNCARPFRALPHTEQAVAMARDDPDALFIAAVTAMQINRFDDALRYLDHALALAPDHLPSLVQRGRALRDMGDLDAARAVAVDLLARSPNDENARDIYFHVTEITPDDRVWADVQTRLLPQYQKIGGTPLARLLQTMGKAWNDLGDYDAAFAAFKQAKTLVPAAHDSAAYTNFVSTLAAKVNSDSFSVPTGSPSRQPILIVGMPRSGSTLLEQILTGHPAIDSAGESPSLNVMVQDIGVRKHNGQDMAQAIAQIPAEATLHMSARYLAETAQVDAPTHVIDKSLHNFELLGLFAKLFPRAPIIHIVRDPLDTCTSCYMQPLSAWHSYTTDLTALGKYYVAYRRLMDHWAQVLPNPIITVSYEDLIADVAGTAQRVTGFLELPWDAACLDFQINRNASRTLSSAQVRQPIYTSAQARWRRYETHLGPLKAALAPLYPEGLVTSGMK